MINAALDTHAAQALSQHLFATPNSIPNIARSLATVGATAFAVEATAMGLIGALMTAASALPARDNRNNLDEKLNDAVCLQLGILNGAGAVLAGTASWLGYRWVCQSALPENPWVQHLWPLALLPYAAISLGTASAFCRMGKPFIR